MAVNTYYFDGSDATVSDPNGVWLIDTNAEDGSTGTYASSISAGSLASNYLKFQGTNASGSDTVTQVRARLYYTWANASGTGGVNARIYTDSESQVLGDITATPVNASLLVTSYIVLTEPTDGWTWAKVQALEARAYNTTSASGAGNGGRLYKIEVEVTSETVSSLSDGNYHWQAWTTKSGTDSSKISHGGNLESATDFTIGSVAVSGYKKVHTGSAWETKPVKVWTGSAWETKPVKHYSGGQWVES